MKCLKHFTLIFYDLNRNDVLDFKILNVEKLEVVSNGSAEAAACSSKDNTKADLNKIMGASPVQENMQTAPNP